MNDEWKLIGKNFLRCMSKCCLFIDEQCWNSTFEFNKLSSWFQINSLFKFDLTEKQTNNSINNGQKWRHWINFILIKSAIWLIYIFIPFDFDVFFLLHECMYVAYNNNNNSDSNFMYQFYILFIYSIFYVLLFFWHNNCFNLFII